MIAVVNEVRLIACQLYSNGHWFVTNAPPVILFAACIIFFALILSALAYYVTVTESIRNPDVSKVWNCCYLCKVIRFWDTHSIRCGLLLLLLCGLSVYLLVTSEPIKMPFGIWTRGTQGTMGWSTLSVLHPFRFCTYELSIKFHFSAFLLLGWQEGHPAGENQLQKSQTSVFWTSPDLV